LSADVSICRVAYAAYFIDAAFDARCRYCLRYATRVLMLSVDDVLDIDADAFYFDMPRCRRRRLMPSPSR